MPRYYTLTEGDMRELNELRSDAFGVVKKDSAIAMSGTTKTLVIGLGGMGINTVWNLKKTLTKRVGKIRDSDVRFLALDTDEMSLSSLMDTGRLTPDETFFLFNRNIAALLKAPAFVRPPAMKNILPDGELGNIGDLCGRGSGQTRLNGRLSLMDSDIFSQLTQKLKTAIAGLQDVTCKKLDIHVVAGIGGGTGSGLIIDIPYIIRKVAAELGMPDRNVNVFGHIYLPNVYQGIQGINLDACFRNGYAALKEIDYYMNIHRIGEKFEALYPNGPFISDKAIFDYCMLIDGRSALAFVVDPREKAITTCVEDLCNRILGGGDSAYGMSFYHYTCMGTARLEFPTDAIIEYVVGKIYKNMTDQLRANVTTLKQTDVDDFAKNVIVPNDVIRPYQNKFNSLVDELFGSCDFSRSSVESRDIASALDAIVNNVYKSFDAQGDLTSRACANACNKAAALFQDPAKGPYYLARLLTANSMEGDGVVGYYQKLDSYATACANRVDAQTYVQARNKGKLEELIQTMQKFGHFNRNLDNYKKLLKSIWLDELEIKLYKKLAEEYYLRVGGHMGSCYQIRSTLDRKYLQYTDIVTWIGEILSDNAAVRKDQVFKDDLPGSIFGLTDAMFDPLKSSVRHSVNKKINNFDEQDVRDLSGALMSSIMENPEKWAMDTNRVFGESVCAASLRNFIYNYQQFNDITQKTFSSYFDEAYKTETPARKETIVKCIVDHLTVNAAPMFNVFSTFTWTNAQELCHRFMIIPNNMGVAWGSHFKQGWGGNTHNMYNPCQDAISCSIVYTRFPLWLHAQIAEYEKAYYENQYPGIHINESTAMDPPWRDYPPLFPPQQWYRLGWGTKEYRNPHEERFRADLQAEIEKAKAAGIICRNPWSGFDVELLHRHPEDGEQSRFLEEYSAAGHGTESVLHLWTAVKARFGVVSVPICGIGGLRPDQDENLLELIRKQMQLVGKLKKELVIFENFVEKFRMMR